jgi:hypothetical protein
MKHFLDVAERQMEAVRVEAPNMTHFREQAKPAVRFELATKPSDIVPSVKDIVEKLEKADRMQRVIDSLGPWASAAMDDPGCCDKLKTIFNAVLELANVGMDFCMACGASVPPMIGEGTCPKCDPAGCALNAIKNAAPRSEVWPN